MPLVIALATFIAVAFMVYGLLYKVDEEAESLVGRLGNLRSMRPAREALPDPSAPFTQRVIRPLIRSLVARVNAMLPTQISERLEATLRRGGVAISAGQFILIVGITAGLIPLLVAVFLASTGSDAKTLMIGYGIAAILGGYGPRLWLGGRVKSRQKEIWKAIPDAFDLITASVEAGLGIDAAFARVLEKTQGPFAFELAKTMREVQMGRLRKDALKDLGERCGVEELRSLLNAVIQAEAMGISVGTVIRVQTGVMRTKRRQRAEERAFKAPVKMVFPLVLFIFPAIMVVILGPAVVQFMEGGLTGGG